MIELLVVIAVIATLAALLLPALKSAKSTAIATICKNHIRQITTASYNYADEWNGVLPHNGNPADWASWQNLSMDHWYQKLSSIYVRGSKEGTVMHCPQTTATIKPRWYFVDRCDFDYTGNYNIVMKKTGGGWSTMGPYVKHLTSQLAWYFDCSMSLNSNTWYAGEWGYPSGSWMLTTTFQFYGQGHPGRTANIGFGDGHVEPLDRSAVLQRSGTSGSQSDKDFNGWATP